jgi:hypothetical protein
LTTKERRDVTVPNPTPIYRLVHVDNLDTIVRRRGMHGTNHIPNDGLPYRTIHNAEIQLDKVDWDMVCERYWADNMDDMDRQRRKQAEFLVHRFCPWDMIQEIGVVNPAAKASAEAILNHFPPEILRPVRVQRAWYY